VLREEDVVESVRYLAGQTPTAEALNDLAHRLVANVWRLHREKPVPPWSVQLFKEWVPVEITACECLRNRHNRLGGLFTFKILAGTSCPLLIRKWWSLPFCRYWSRFLGFSRPVSDRQTAAPPKYPFQSVDQLVRFRLYVLIEPRLCEPGRPMFDREVRVTSSLAAWNQSLVRWRFRVDPGHNCPQGYPASHACHRCVFGYKETCNIGTHPRDYVTEPCPRCGDQKAPFDPARPKDMCVNCRVKAQLARH